MIISPKNPKYNLIMSYRVDVPEGTSGDWTIERFSVSKENEARQILRAIINRDGRCVPAGDYTKLMCADEIIMSDTPDEIWDHWELFERSKRVETIRIHGLGLGMASAGVIRKLRVRKLDVVEISQDVIALVGPWLHEKAKKYHTELTIIHSDALLEKPSRTYDLVWHDIWPEISEDNLVQMYMLHERWKKYCKWQDSWSRDIAETTMERTMGGEVGVDWI